MSVSDIKHVAMAVGKKNIHTLCKINTCFIHINISDLSPYEL